jgi:glucosamine-6-phosphate deaminase
MDEYVGLKPEHPQSYHHFMWSNLFNHIDIRPENVHILNGMADDLQAECDRYESLIDELGGIELFLGGIGPDGHIAFNEPGSSLSSRTRVKTLAYDTIVANSRFFGGDISKVPTMALTVGVGTVMDAREIVIIITGVSKALALHKCIEEGVSHMWTVSCLQQHPRSCIACDEDATLECKVKTIRYFKGLQATQLKLLQLPMQGYSGTMSRGGAASLARGSSVGSLAAGLPEDGPAAAPASSSASSSPDAAAASMSSAARMAVQEASGTRLSAASVMLAMSKAAKRLSATDDRSVTSVEAASAFKNISRAASAEGAAPSGKRVREADK